jgi:hypothetical protein
VVLKGGGGWGWYDAHALEWGRSPIGRRGRAVAERARMSGGRAGGGSGHMEAGEGTLGWGWSSLVGHCWAVAVG